MNNSSKTVRIRPKHYSKLHGTSICSFSTELAALLTRNITKFVEEPVWVLVGDPSQTKDVSAINLAENHSVCLQIAQRFRTVATHHKLTSKPAGMPAELWNIVQIVIPRGSKMSLAVLFRTGFERLVLDSVRAPGKLLGCFCGLFCII